MFMLILPLTSLHETSHRLLSSPDIPVTILGVWIRSTGDSKSLVYVNVKVCSSLW